MLECSLRIRRPTYLPYSSLNCIVKQLAKEWLPTKHIFWTTTTVLRMSFLLLQQCYFNVNKKMCSFFNICDHLKQLLRKECCIWCLLLRSTMINIWDSLITLFFAFAYTFSSLDKKMFFAFTSATQNIWAVLTKND